MTTLTIFAGDALSEEQLYDPVACAERVSNVTEMIVGLRIEGIQMIQRIETGCMLIVHGNDQALQEVRDGLQSKNFAMHLNDGSTMCRG